ncbi:putative cation transporter [Sphingomonas changbaiensis NBRC 104936]|uniref:Putative cation transporter n=1 Tax=Sphingomonas changbaiensis NBRC 104936 TaxID=1219043 RepID=A0A0E9MTE7_9SPHN|nr:cation diffusion facilitator family transporter [Sphingomonas changbaiensis]GAO40385.1 putative cation transporter [Sphingomonas changbaiensis NBRC 104936]
MPAPESRTSIIAALVGNLLIAATKGVAAALSGSSAMLSESVHSLVDSGNEILLLYGQHRAAKPPDEQHPFGYGRELYFWCFVVALLIFAVGAGVSIYEGILHIRHPEPNTRPTLSYIVFGLAFLFEGASWWFGWRAFRQAKGKLAWWTAVRVSKDPTSFMVFFEDSAALIGIVIAAVGTFVSVELQKPWIDGVASILIGGVLAAVSVVLARESKALLIGERASPVLTESIEKMVAADPCVESVESITTSQLAPDKVFAALGLQFDDSLSVSDIEHLIARLEDRIRAEHPELFRIFVRPQPREPELSLDSGTPTR